MSHIYFKCLTKISKFISNNIEHKYTVHHHTWKTMHMYNANDGEFKMFTQIQVFSVRCCMDGSVC